MEVPPPIDGATGKGTTSSVRIHVAGAMCAGVAVAPRPRDCGYTIIRYDELDEIVHQVIADRGTESSSRIPARFSIVALDGCWVAVDICLDNGIGTAGHVIEVCRVVPHSVTYAVERGVDAAH